MSNFQANPVQEWCKKSWSVYCVYLKLSFFLSDIFLIERWRQNTATRWVWNHFLSCRHWTYMLVGRVVVAAAYSLMLAWRITALRAETDYIQQNIQKDASTVAHCYKLNSIVQGFSRTCFVLKLLPFKILSCYVIPRVTRFYFPFCSFFFYYIVYISIGVFKFIFD